MKNFTFFFIVLMILAFNNTLTAQLIFYTEQNSGVTSNLTSASATGGFNSNRVWVCGTAGVVLKSTNNGTNWISVGSNGIPSNANLVNINCKTFDTALTAGNIGTTAFVYRTSNGGTNWTPVFTQSNGNINAIWMKNAVQGIMVGNPVGGRWSIWKTSNGGLNWDSTGLYLQQAGSENGWPNSLAIMYNYIWFGTNNSRLYKSTNDGLNWAPISSSTQTNSSAVWIYHDTSGNVYVDFGGNSAFYTSNGGINWVSQNCPDTGKFVGFSPAYLGVDNFPMGMYTVRNNTKIYYGAGNFFGEYTAPAGVYNHMSYDLGFMYSSYVWAVRTNGGITRISLFRGGGVKRIAYQIPAEFSLRQNFPNPFNPVTKIRFDIPKQSNLVTIKVYDLLGRETATIINQVMQPGSYEAEFDGKNLSSGIYFYRINAGSFTDIKKMILVK